MPHFEKMLYDNALLARAYCMPSRCRGALFRRVPEETLDWAMREMRQDEAGSVVLDADSEGVEGKFYVWTPERSARPGASWATGDRALRRDRGRQLRGANILVRATLGTG